VADEQLSPDRASAAVELLGWRYLLGGLAATVAVGSLRRAVDVAGAATDACGDDADEHLRVDVRGDRVELLLQAKSTGLVTTRDVALAHRIADSVRALGFDILTPTRLDGTRTVQVLEIAIDTMDFAVIRPFWKAVLAYVDAPDPEDTALIDPVGQGPAIWFQQMDEPRPQRNRIHFDITVPHDEADRRVRAALAADGTLVSDAAARSFWILADAEGNEVCVCTWQDRLRPDGQVLTDNGNDVVAGSRSAAQVPVSGRQTDRPAESTSAVLKSIKQNSPDGREPGRTMATPLVVRPPVSRLVDSGGRWRPVRPGPPRRTCHLSL